MQVQRDGRVRRSAEDWAKIFQQFDASGQSAVAFCRREGIGLSSFQRWQRRRSVDAASAKFIELAASPLVTPVPAWSIDVTLPNGVRLAFRG